MKTFLTCIVILSALLFCYAIGCFATEDVTGPVLTGFSFSPSTVNTSSGAQTITFNMTITDALSGFEHGTLSLVSPNRGQSVAAVVNSANRTSGTALNGVYSVVVQVPQYSNVGTWSVYLDLADVTGNHYGCTGCSRGGPVRETGMIGFPNYTASYSNFACQ